MYLAVVLAFWMQNAFLLLDHVGEEFDAATLGRMKQREVYLREQMTQLLQEVEMQESWMGMPSLLFAALQSWHFWALAAVLPLSFGLVWLLWKRRCQVSLGRLLGIFRRRQQQQEEDEEEEQDPNDVLPKNRFFLEFSIWPLEKQRSSCWPVQELVEELLSVCRVLPKSYFMPRLQPALGASIGFEEISLDEDKVYYRMLVPLKPPPGHTFHLEMEVTRGVRNSCLRVELQCTCTRERLVRDMLCFLHHPEERLRRRQMPSLLHTLCTDGYLDLQKTAAWLQDLVRQAWREMPQASTMQLEVLPSSRFCKLRLTTASSRVIGIELMLGMQQGDSDTFLSFE